MDNSFKFQSEGFVPPVLDLNAMMNMPNPFDNSNGIPGVKGTRGAAGDMGSLSGKKVGSDNVT